MTVNRFFQVGVSEDTKMKKFDDSLFDVIVFDEIFKCPISILTRIKNYVETHPDKIILATGDTDQNKPVETLSTEIDHKTYAHHCLDVIFKNQIRLRINKRLASEKDRKMISVVKADILNPDVDLNQTIQKYFRYTTTPAENNIAYRNEVAEDVSRSKRKLLKRKDVYELGEKLLCVSDLKHQARIKQKITNI